MEEINNRNTKALIKPQLLIVIGVILLVVLGVIFLPRFIKPGDKLNEQAMVGGTLDGVFTGFSASATGKVTRISSSEIEIENAGVKRVFKIASSALITNKSLLDNLASLLVSEASAQEEFNMPIPPRPGLPSDSNISTNSADVPNIPPAPRKEISEIKVGDFVSLSLSKNKEADPWVVTGITVLPK